MSIEESENIDIVGLIMGTLLGVSFSFSLIVNLFVGQSMSKLLGFIKNLQILVHLTLMQVMLPANS